MDLYLQPEKVHHIILDEVVDLGHEKLHLMSYRSVFLLLCANMFHHRLC